MPDVLIRGMQKLESGKSYRALFKELHGRFVIVVEQVESYADRDVKIYEVKELPPHGDLKDARQICEEIDDIWDGRPLAPIGAKVLAIIDSATVVVPAERREG